MTCRGSGTTLRGFRKEKITCYNCMGTGKSEENITSAERIKYNQESENSMLEERHIRWEREDMEW